MKFKPGSLVVLSGSNVYWTRNVRLDEQNNWTISISGDGRIMKTSDVALYVDFFIGESGYSSLDIILLGEQLYAINIGRLGLYKICSK